MPMGFKTELRTLTGSCFILGCKEKQVGQTCPYSYSENYGSALAVHAPLINIVAFTNLSPCCLSTSLTQFGCLTLTHSSTLPREGWRTSWSWIISDWQWPQGFIWKTSNKCGGRLAMCFMKYNLNLQNIPLLHSLTCALPVVMSRLWSLPLLPWWP